MNGQFVNEAGSHFGEMMRGFTDYAKGMQTSPIGEKPRSARELTDTWKRLTSLPDDQFEEAMETVALKVGHENNEETPCQLCKFIMTRAAKGAKS